MTQILLAPSNQLTAVRGIPPESKPTAVGYSLKLAIARDLERLYSPVLAEPVPAHLKSFVNRLGQALGEKAARQ